MKAGGPFTLKVSGTNTLKLDDILVGEVWLCSGQSNMEMGIGNRPTDNPDWTFANNAGAYSSKRLRVLVHCQ